MDVRLMVVCSFVRSFVMLCECTNKQTNNYTNLQIHKCTNSQNEVLQMDFYTFVAANLRIEYNSTKQITGLFD